MSWIRSLALVGSLLLPLAVPASAESWLQGELTTPEAPAAPADFLGLELQERTSFRYHHPFEAEPTAAIREVRVRTAEPQGLYLLRTAPGPAESQASLRFLRNRKREVTALGFRWLAQPPRGGVAHTPLMGIVRFEGTDPLETPSWVQLAPVSGARVHLCLLSLDALGEESWEAPIAISEELPPETALRRAWSLYRYAQGHWGSRGTITLEELGDRWPDAAAALAVRQARPEGILLALRVIWTSGDQEIPGPGGMSLHAVRPNEARRRLQLLYAPPGS